MDFSLNFILCLLYNLKLLEIVYLEMVKWNTVDKKWVEDNFGEKRGVEV